MSKHTNIEAYRRSALILNGFNGVTAFLGGIGVTTNLFKMPESWLHGSVFESFLFPGLILMLVVGGSSLFAAIRAVNKTADWPTLTAAAGVIMIGWIFGEVLIINQFNWLHLIFLLTGASALITGWVATRLPGDPA